MSVRAENRWKQRIKSENDAAADLKIAIEASRRIKRKTTATHEASNTSSRAKVRSWMRNNASCYGCATELAEAANIALGLPAGAMDDGSHWVWDEALNAIEAAESIHDKEQS